ncbi:MAG TPA: hypothetical protein VLS89_11795 [Candidatus Nanopelagicales bacterium]|nr:hypothetical protein [Candidatus Nanopelagicales bacterium]
MKRNPMIRQWFGGVAWLLLAALSACGGGAVAGPGVDAAEYQGGEALNPRLPDGRIVHLGFDSHHPECFVFSEGAGEGAGGEKKTEEVECPAEALRLDECQAGVVYRSKKQPGCVCVPAGGEEARRIGCPE